MSNLYIVVVTFNCEKFIDKFIQSVGKVMPLSRLIVVDNNSKDKTVLEIKKYKKVTLIRKTKNLGYGAGNNIGIKHALKAGAGYVLVLNPDILLNKDCIKYLLTSFDENKKLAVAGPKILTGDNKIWAMGGVLDKKRYSAKLVDNGKKDNNANSFKNLDFISGTAMLIKREVFDKIGFFDESYFLYYEDVDFCQRALKAGFEIAVNPKAKITHFESSTVGKNSKIMQYYMARNHLLFVEKFAPVRIKLRELIRMPKTLYQARSRKHELLGILDYFLRKRGKANI